MTTELETSFADLGLSAPIISALNDLGYVKPSPIQAECIPHLLNGRDVLGMAQTGSGKTAAVLAAAAAQYRRFSEGTANPGAGANPRTGGTGC